MIEVKGEELELLDELCTEIKEKITGIPGIYDIKSSLEKGAPEINIKIDRLKSGIYGIDVATVSNQVSEKLAGKDAGTFETQGETIDINIKVPEVTLSEIYDIEIVQGEKKYRLGEIADIEITSAPKEINRINQSRTGIVTAMIEKQYSLSHITPAIQEKLSEVEFPAKYSAKITGEEEMRQESFSGLGFALFLSILLVYMVMAAQFESLAPSVHDPADHSVGRRGMYLGIPAHRTDTQHDGLYRYHHAGGYCREQFYHTRGRDQSSERGGTPAGGVH